MHGWSWYHFFLGHAKQSRNARFIRVLVILEIMVEAIMFFVNIAHDFRFAVVQGIPIMNTLLCIVHELLSVCSLSWHDASHLLDSGSALATFIIVFVTSPSALAELMEQQKHCRNFPNILLVCSERDPLDPRDARDQCVESTMNSCPTNDNEGYYYFIHGVMVAFVVYQMLSSLLILIAHARFRSESTHYHSNKRKHKESHAHFYAGSKAAPGYKPVHADNKPKPRHADHGVRHTPRHAEHGSRHPAHHREARAGLFDNNLDNIKGEHPAQRAHIPRDVDSDTDTYEQSLQGIRTRRRSSSSTGE